MKTAIKYTIASISSFLIDQGLFRLFLLFLSPLISSAILVSTYLARAISSFVNYLLNKNKVFENKSKNKNTIIKYYLLVIFSATLSGILVTIVYKFTKIDESIIKIIIDLLIFVFNYFIQKKYIFKNN